jgi:hypothetical protein
MAHSRIAKPVSKGRSKPSLRASAERSFVGKAIKAFSSFQDEPYLRPTAPELGFCFVKTPLGVLQIDIGWLLMLVGHIISDGKVHEEGKRVEIELTDDILDATVEIVRAVPRYIERDLLGMYFEAEGLVRFKTELNPRLREIGIDKPYTVEKLCKLLFVHGEKREIIDLTLLGKLLTTPDLAGMSVPEIMEAFVGAISEQGPVGAKPWRKFVEQHFRKKQGKGRRRQELYDVLFKKRTENPGLSYGRLAREVAKSKNIEFSVARDQVKAAIAYRRKKMPATNNS